MGRLSVRGPERFSRAQGRGVIPRKTRALADPGRAPMENYADAQKQSRPRRGWTAIASRI